jgi:hypothetical protein
MTNFIYPVSDCCGTGTDFSDEDPICSQCGEHCEIVEGDEETISFDKESEIADQKNDEDKLKELESGNYAVDQINSIFRNFFTE